MPVPGNYQYDYCNHYILMKRLAVRNGRVETPEGLSYRLIWLQNTRRMLPETVERLADLATQGAVIVGDPPDNIATLIGGQQSERKFREAVKSLWGESGESERPVGKGLVLSGLSVGGS